MKNFGMNYIVKSLLTASVFALFALVGSAFIHLSSWRSSLSNRAKSYGRSDVMMLATGASERNGISYLPSEEREAYILRYAKFAKLRQAKRQQDITRDLIALMADPVQVLRIHAARELGRLECTAAEPQLAKLATHADRKIQKIKNIAEAREASSQMDYDRLQAIPFPTLQLALGRIRARNLKGRAKIDALCQSVNLTFTDVVKLSQKVNSDNSMERWQACGSMGQEIVDEVVDLLYAMRKHGENVDSEVAQLKLNSAQDVQLRGALLPNEKEVELIITYLSQRNRVSGSDDQLATYHLASLGGHVAPLLNRFMNELADHPEKFQDKYGCGPLIIVAGNLHDESSLPIVKRLEKLSIPFVRDSAMRAHECLEQDSQAQTAERSKAS
jgi:hypothetical protein